MLNPIEIRCESTEINPSKAPLDSDPYEPLPEDVTEQVRRKELDSLMSDLMNSFHETLIQQS